MGFQLDRQSRLPYAVQVVRQAAAQFVAGRLHPGDRLPSVRQLARQLRVSRSTAERIHDALCDSLLAEVRPRSGTFVASDLERPEVRQSVQAVYGFLKETVERAQRLGLNRHRLAQLLGSLDFGEVVTTRPPTVFPVVATRDFFECVRLCLGTSFPAKLIHVPPSAKTVSLPRGTRYMLTSYYMRTSANTIAERTGCSLLYMRFNEKLIDQAMAIPEHEHRYLLTRDRDNADCTIVFLGNAYPEVPAQRYTVAPVGAWLEDVEAVEGQDQIWVHATALPFLKGRVAPGRLRLFHPILAEEFVDELRCLTLLG